MSQNFSYSEVIPAISLHGKSQRYIHVPGKNREALDWLEKAYQDHDANMSYIGVDPIFNGLRDNPRFDELLKKMKLPRNI